MSGKVVHFDASRRPLPCQAPSLPPARATDAGGSAASAVRMPAQARDMAGAGAPVEGLAEHLAGTLLPDDRILLIGAGLGIVSTLAARAALDGSVVVADPNPVLIGLAERVHALNGVTNAETLNSVLAVGRRGFVRFLPQNDPRTPACGDAGIDGSPGRMVPFMDLDLILAEARINVILCDTPAAPAALLAQADLGGVERILVHRGCDPAQCWGGEGVCMVLASQGYEARAAGPAIRFCRPARRPRQAGLAQSG